MVNMKQSALFLTELVAYPFREIQSQFVRSSSGHFPQDDFLVITQCNQLQGKLPIESASLGVIILVLQTVNIVDGQLLEEINRVLKPSGKISVQLSPIAGHLDQLPLQRQLLLAGFVEVEPVESNDNPPSLIIVGKKASWNVGSVFSIKKARTLPEVMMDDESDLIDEDSLLTEEDLKKPQVPVVSDCDVGRTRKACKNCTCGRAEEEEKVLLGLTAEQITNPQSACGSCGLGDAFRCTGCPYRGLPPFQLGEKVSLSLVDDI